MKLYKSVQKNGVSINDIFTKRFNITINPRDLYLKILSPNSNFSEISRQDWKNNKIWWFSLLLNKGITPFYLNIGEQQILDSIKHSINTNPIEFFKPEIISLCNILYTTIMSYSGDITDSVELTVLSNMLTNISKIKQYINIIPLKSDCEITNYEILRENELKIYKSQIYDFIHKYNFEYLWNVLPSAYIQKSQVINLTSQSNDTFIFQCQYNGVKKSITHLYTDNVLNQIKTAFNTNAMKTTGNYLFSNTKVEITAETTNLSIIRYDIKKYIDVLNSMLQIIVKWSKNEKL